MKFETWLERCHDIMKAYRKILIQHVKYWCHLKSYGSQGSVIFEQKCQNIVNGYFELFNKLPTLPEDRIFYRAIDRDEMKGSLRYSIPIPTSMTKDLPLNWINKKGYNHRMLLKIHVPKGSKVIPISDGEYPSWMGRAEIPKYVKTFLQEEKEMILFPGKLLIRRKLDHMWICDYVAFQGEYIENFRELAKALFQDFGYFLGKRKKWKIWFDKQQKKYLKEKKKLKFIKMTTKRNK